MGKFLEEIPEYLAEWILQQQMFWVASAPLSPDGHVNISPKAIEGTFHVVNSRRVWYEDLSGTGAETVAHIRENGRVTILFHAFEGPARIVRLYGKGFFHEIGTPEYDALIGPHKRLAGSRAIIGLDVHKVGTTCGYAVPYYQFLSHRTQLMTWAARKEAKDHELADMNKQPLLQSDQHPVPSAIDEHAPINPDGMKQWWQSHNLLSLDGLPAFSVNLGRGFPFSSIVKSKRNGKVPETSAARSALSVQPNSSSMHIHMGTPSKNSPPTAWSQIQTQRKYLGLSYPHHDILLLLPRIFPYLIVLFIGIFIGRISNYSRYFAALGLWRDAA
ncbi:hypothetical protein HYPSUDRAFT_40895 [Hypholoma sublateritium FD-334 SS-4]|uniref:Pyridoxamine 5'-phosphate oxidase N-terminal domain-containing protein n=1 Tax=Hypholoma sublateritium (strain FD-334 SS-4) TaxID=945553 RepID=A0A0D2PRQ5_HYPSF|nr:hypothetical protein HYPSUDRAFT_40895 [Hypholoma sublateritium FD-334 SS-4]